MGGGGWTKPPEQVLPAMVRYDTNHRVISPQTCKKLKPYILTWQEVEHQEPRHGTCLGTRNTECLMATYKV